MLQQLSFIDKEIGLMQREADDYKKMLTSIKATDYTVERIQGGQSSDIADRIAGLYDRQRAINKRVDELWDLKVYLGNLIDKLAIDNMLYAIILRERYLLNRSWEKIAVSLSYTIRHIYKLHGHALLAIEEIHKHDTK